MEKIVVENLYKVFGNQPGKAMEMLKKGGDKESILEKTGMTVGVDNASFSIEAGEIFVIMGLSGSGKSTIVRMLNRLIEPTAGKVLVDGKNVVEMDEKELVKFRLHNMSMVFQSFALMPHLSVIDNAAFGLELAGIEKEKTICAGQGRPRSGRPCRLGGILSQPAFRRYAAARGTRPWLGRGSRHPAHGRGIFRAGPADPNRNAGRTPQAPGRAETHHRLHFSRSRRSLTDRRPHCHHGERAGDPGRRTGRDSSKSRR